MAQEPWQPAPEHRLRRSSRERMWAGVAGGLAEYFDVDPVLTRLMWVVATVVTAGLFVAVYIVMWVIMPLDTDLPAEDWKQPDATAGAEQATGSVAADAAGGWDYGKSDRWRGYWTGMRAAHDYDYYGYRGRKKRSAGLVLIVLGVLFLGSQAGVFRWINWSVAWAIVLIVVGAALLLRHHDWRP